MTEEELSTEVKKLAKFYGWRIHHERPARTIKGWRTPMEGDPGFPDWILLREDADSVDGAETTATMIVSELKSERGTVPPDQKEWLRLFSKVKIVKTFLWRPKDLEQIEMTLRGEP